jgi:hypothetical protein
MTKHPRHNAMNISIPFLIVVSIMAAFLLVVPVCAGSVHAEGPGWKFNATETLVINPATGTPFPSMGALDQALYPGLWATMSPAARAAANNTPAVSRSFDLSYALNASQQEVANLAEARSVTEAGFLSAVLPDLWAAIPEWQKELYRNEQHRSISSSLPPVNGQFTGPFFVAPGSFTPTFTPSTAGFTFGNAGTPTGGSGSSWLSLGDTNIPTGASAGSWLSFGNAGTPTGGSGSSWLSLGDTNIPTGASAGSWLSFGNTGTPTGEIGSSWLTPGQIATVPAVTPDIPHVPVDFTWHTMPFSNTDLSHTSDPLPLVLPTSPFRTSGISPAGTTFSGPYLAGWPAV